MALLADKSADANSNLVSGAGTNSRTFTMPANQALKVESVVATIDNAAGNATVCELVIRDQSGVVIATKRQTDTIPAAGTGTATWALRLGGDGGGSQASLVILNYVSFDPVAGFVQVTSTNPAAPTTIATSGAVTMDGVTQLRIEFAVAGIDLDQRGLGNSCAQLLELYRDSTAIGILSDINASTGLYFITPCTLVTFDTPPAGNVTYSIRGYLQPSGGAAVGNSFVYGANVATPHTTRPGYLALIKAVQA